MTKKRDEYIGTKNCYLTKEEELKSIRAYKEFKKKRGLEYNFFRRKKSENQIQRHLIRAYSDCYIPLVYNDLVYRYLCKC